ncbi:MAG: DoxX family protein [Candidatus Rokuibacteriota bacterium]
MIKTETMAYSAPRPGLMGHLLAARALLERVPFSIVQLVCRLAIAGVFLRAGLQKVAGWETTLALFSEEYKLPLLPPEFAATMATATEVGCSILLLFGLATRVATLPFFGMILTIQLFVFPHAWPEHLTWTAILLVLFTRGAGAVSIDRVIGHWLDRRRD